MKPQPSNLIVTRLLASGLCVWAVACASSEEPAYGPVTTNGAASGTTGNGAAGPSAGPVTGTATTSPGTTTGSVAGSTTGATGTTTASSGATVTSGGGGAAATSTTTATTTATATTGTEDFCLTRPTLVEPTISGFEDYDGTTVAGMYGFTLFDDGTVQRYAGLYENTDMTGTPTFSMVAGNASSWAVSASNPAATDWGGGVGVWINCVNASSFTGISLAVRGSTPTGNVSVAVTADNLTEGVSTDVAITDTFTVHQIPFSMLTNSASETTNGDNLTGIAIGAGMSYVDDGTGVYVPEPGAYEVVVDDLSFY